MQAGTITQLEFIRWLAQAAGEGAAVNASAADAVAWAQGKGMSPNGGWDPGAVLTKDVLAQTLVQAFKLNPKKFGGDFERQLLREGIVLPNEAQITREGLTGVIDNFQFQGVAVTVVSSTGSGTNGDNGHGSNIPPPGFRNPRNPWFGFANTDGTPGVQGPPPGKGPNSGGQGRSGR